MSHHRQSAWYGVLLARSGQRRRKQVRQSAQRRCRVEPLEPRTLLSSVWGSTLLADDLQGAQAVSPRALIGPIPAPPALISGARDELRHSPVSHLQDVAKMIVAGDPNGTPADSPDLRVDPNLPASEFAGVGSLQIRDGAQSYICTATAISLRHVLTAAHCLDLDDTGDIDVTPQNVTFRLNHTSSPLSILGSALAVHPSWTGFNSPSVNDDVAVVTLSTDIPADVPVYPLYDSEFQGSETMTLVGYGRSGNGVNGYTVDASFTVKRYGQNQADLYDTDDEGSGVKEVFEYDFDGPTSSTNRAGGLTLGNDVETTLGGGDSGGPAFVRVNGELQVFGINTYTFRFGLFTAAAPKFGSGGGGIVVAPYTDFINSVVSGNPVVPQTIAVDSFDTGTFAGGAGWNESSWLSVGDVRIRTNVDGPHSAPSHVRLRAGSGYLQRSADLSDFTNVHLQFWARVNSFESADQAKVLVSSNGVEWTEVMTFKRGDSTQYRQYDVDLSPFAMTDTFFVAFDANMRDTNDRWFIDDVQFVTMAAASGGRTAPPVTGGFGTSAAEPVLQGTVSCNSKTHTVYLRPSTGNGAMIRNDVPTWIVIHGRNSSPSSANLVQLAAALDGYSISDQVLVLDWSAAAASGLLGGAGENCIKPVATWASSTLAGYGLSPDKLNLAGHSWGAYVAAELAERQPTAQVNSIVALDPAIDYWGGSYNPTASGEVNFARNSRFSWAFYAYGGSLGSATTASTADESFVVKSTDHSKLVNAVANLVSIINARPAARQIDEQFVTQAGELRLLVGIPHPSWIPNSYSSSGKRSATGTFEAVITATRDKLGVLSLEFYNGSPVILPA